MKQLTLCLTLSCREGLKNASVILSKSMQSFAQSSVFTTHEDSDELVCFLHVFPNEHYRYESVSQNPYPSNYVCSTKEANSTVVCSLPQSV